MSRARRSLRAVVLSAGAFAFVATRVPPGPPWTAEGSAPGPTVAVSLDEPARFAVSWSSSAPSPDCEFLPSSVPVVVTGSVARPGPDDPNQVDVLVWSELGGEEVVQSSFWLDGPAPEDAPVDLTLDARSVCDAAGCSGEAEVLLQALADTTFEVTWTVAVRASCSVGREDDPPAAGEMTVLVEPLP